MIRVFVIEDHPIFMNGLKYDFRKSRDNIEITATALSIKDVLIKGKSEDFDLFILDLWLPHSHPVDNVKLLKEKFPDKPILILTSEESPFWKQQMFLAGAKAYIIKNTDKKELKNAIQRVAVGETVLPSFSFLNDSSSVNRDEVMNNFIIKPSEKEIFYLMANGLTQKDIAEKQHKTVSAIEKVVAKVNKQYQSGSTAETIHMFTFLKEI